MVTGAFDHVIGLRSWLRTIRGRLTLSMAILIGLAASSSILAVHQFRRGAGELDHLVTENLQVVQKARALNEAILGLSSSVERAIKQNGITEYSSHYAETLKNWQSAYDLTQAFDATERALIADDLAAMIQALDDRLVRLDDAARDRLALERDEKHMHVARARDLETLRERLTEVADRTDLAVRRAVRDARSEPSVTAGSIDDLVDANFVAFRSILRLKAALSEIGSIVARVPSLDGEVEIKAAEQQFQALLATINSLVSVLETEFPDAGLSLVVSTLQEWGSGQGSLFSQRARLLAARYRMEAASDDTALKLSKLQSAIEAYYSGVLSRTGGQVEALETGVAESLVSVLVALGVSILFALLVARRLVFQGIVAPLGRIEGAIRAVADGRTDVEIPQTRTEELSRIAAALGILKGYVHRVVAAESDARRQEVLFRSLLDASPDGTLIVDGDGTIVIANARAGILFNATRDQLVGKSVDMLVPDGVRPRHKANRDGFMAASSVREMGASLNLTARRLDGSLFPVEISLSPIATDTGKLVFASVRDITARKEAERALRESQLASSLLREALDTFDDSVILYDRNERVIFTNDAYHRIYPAAPTREAIVGRTMEDLLRSSLAAGQIAAPRALTDPEGWLEETMESRRGVDRGTSESTHRSGRTYIVRWGRTTEGGTLLVHYDVSELKQLQGELIEAKTAAEEAAKAKANFLATMSHEIRTPMNGVVTMAQILDGTRLTEDQREMTRTIRQSSEALLTIINDILDISKIEAGKLAIERVHFDLLEQIEGVVDLVAPRAEAASLLLLEDLDLVIPETVAGDPTRLRQILLNLLGNAIKFTPAGSVALRIRHVRTDGSQFRMRFEVEDTGIGLSEEQMAGLFRAFSQADSSTARRFGGTGLGLSISKQLVELMGGEIGVASTAGEGSTFWFELPFDLVHDTFVRPEDELSAACVLLVGHDEKEAATLASALRLGGVSRIAWSRDPEQIPPPPGAERFDLVVLDGRPGVPSVVEWGRIVPQALDVSDLNVVVTAPHMALSSLQLSQHVFPGQRLLGTMTVPVRSRRLWGYVAVALGLRTLESLRDASAEVTVFAPPDAALARAHAAMLLVAEDNPTNQAVIARVLNRMGIAHEIAENGEVALSMLADRPYHLLLSDFHMPVMDGLELTRRIRAREVADGAGRLPIVALTADVLPETARQCEEVGMDGYLRKPIELERLEDVLRTFVPAAFEIRRPAVVDAPPPDAAAVPAVAAKTPRELIAKVDRDIFDPDQLRDAFDDFDWDAVKFVLAFLDTVRPEIDAIERAFGTEDYKDARHRAHAMKGALLSIGARRLGRLMQDIQDSLDDDDPETADLYREGLVETCDELEAALAPLRERANLGGV